MYKSSFVYNEPLSISTVIALPVAKSCMHLRFSLQMIEKKTFRKFLFKLSSLIFVRMFNLFILPCIEI